jgi:hypothetical protein
MGAVQENQTTSVWSCGDDPMTITIEWQDQLGRWHHYQSKQNQADAHRVAQRRAESTKSVIAWWMTLGILLI